MKASIIPSIEESYQNLRHASHVHDFEETSKALHETMKQYDMLTRPNTNNKTNSLDLAVLAFCILDEAYFKLQLSDTEESPLSEKERQFVDDLFSCRKTLKNSITETADHGTDFWKLAATVSSAMRIY